MDATSWRRGWECAPAVVRSFARVASICVTAGLMLFAQREAAAQQFTFRHYQQTEGLGNPSTTCLLQDRDGFIWVCTENGLYRYDGVDFERFGDVHGIGSPTIRTAIEDSAGSLWVGTSQDLYRSDGLNFKPIRPEGRHLRLAAGLRIAALSPAHLLVIYGDELLELAPAAAHGQWHSRAFFPQSLLTAIPALAHLSSVYVDGLSRIWLGCGTAICRIDQGEVRVFDVKLGVPEDTWRSWVLDRDGRMWARGQAHLVILEAGASRFEIRDPPNARLTAEVLNVPFGPRPAGTHPDEHGCRVVAVAGRLAGLFRRQRYPNNGDRRDFV